MGITHFKNISTTENGYYVGSKNNERLVISSDGKFQKSYNVATASIGSDAGTTTISLPAMSMVTDVFIKVGTAYAGSGSIDIGDASDTDGFLPDASITKTAGAVSGDDVTARGVYLYDGTNNTILRKFYATATDVVVTVGAGFTAGDATVYVVYMTLE